MCGSSMNLIVTRENRNFYVWPDKLDIDILLDRRVEKEGGREGM